MSDPVAYKIYYNKGKVKQKPVYYDQLYILPFWTNVKLKLKRWMHL